MNNPVKVCIYLIEDNTKKAKDVGDTVEELNSDLEELNSDLKEHKKTLESSNMYIKPFVKTLKELRVNEIKFLHLTDSSEVQKDSIEPEFLNYSFDNVQKEIDRRMKTHNKNSSGNQMIIFMIDLVLNSYEREHFSSNKKTFEPKTAIDITKYLFDHHESVEVILQTQWKNISESIKRYPVFQDGKKYILTDSSVFSVTDRDEGVMLLGQLIAELIDKKSEGDSNGN